MLTETSVFFSPVFYEIRRGSFSLLIDPELPNWIATDERGNRIMSYVDGRRTFQEVVEAYCRDNRVDVAKGWLHCSTFIKDALKVGFLSPSPFVSALYPGRGEVLEPTALRELWLHITNACNLACAHCLVESSPAGIKGIPTADWARLIREAVGLGVKRFYITGGEPFLRDDIFELIEQITRSSASGGEVIILTNAMLLHDERLQRLSQCDRQRVKLQISLDGSCPEVNDPIRGRGTFEATVRGITNVLQIGYQPTVSSVVMEANAEDLPRITRLVAGLGVKNHHLLWAHHRGRAVGRTGLDSPLPETLIEMVKDVMAVAREVGVTIDNFEAVRERLMGKRGVKSDLSNAAYDSLCIYADGHVYPSASFAGHPQMDMGNALESSLREVWLSSPVARALRQATVQKKAVCKDCSLKFLCGGGDIEHTYFYSLNGNGKGNLHAEDPFHPLFEWLVIEGMASIARERSLLRTRSGYDCPIVFYSMGEGAIPEENGHAQSSGFEVNTLHSTCVLSHAVEKSREVVKRFYASAATQPRAELCCPAGTNGDDTGHIPQEVLEISYGCGSPVSAAGIMPGEVVVDLGSGGGIDCFIAAKKVGPQGRVVGIDMTDEMLEKARISSLAVAKNLGYDVVEFRKGYLEEIPLPDKSADVVLSNCVINLSPDKRQVFREMWRVLKDHGRIVLSDTVSADEIPPEMKANPRLWGECVSGALTEEDYFSLLERAGFYGLSLLKKSFWKDVEGHAFYSVVIRGYKCEKTAGCLYVGQKALYRGPFKAVMDEEGHLFPRNEAVEVCTDTAAKLRRPPYEGSFTIVEQGLRVEEVKTGEPASCSPGGGCC